MVRSDEQGSPPVGPRRGAYLRLSRFGAFCLAVLLVLPWVLVLNQAYTRARSTARGSDQDRPATAPATRATTHALPQGPWGELEYTSITIEPPADSVARYAAADTATWYFRDCTPEQLAALLKTAGATDVQRDAILRSTSADPQANGLAARPDPATIAALSRDARTAIYRTLAADSRNAQSEPFRHNADGPDWFADSGLPAETIALVRRYLYQRGTMEAFADLSAVLPAIPDADTRARLFRTLSSQSALNVRLRVRPDADLHQLIEYWGRGRRERDVAPLLESLAQVPGGDTIDVAQLLPAFARSRLNTFPPPVNVDGSVQGIFDCHWTTLNFWNALPDNRFTDPQQAARQFDTDYAIVDRPTQLGDVLMITNPAGQGIHSAAFVAADVVFTKNGSSITAPWILMRLPDVITYYEAIGPVKTVIYRRKDL